MTENRISSMVASDLTNSIKDFSVSTATTDGPADQKETRWIDQDWTLSFGYYTNDKIPEVTIVIDSKATWTVGKGFKANEETTMLLDSIKGNGFDTFNTIIENMIRTMMIGGNAYAHIIKDDEDNLINLKVLDPMVMGHVAGHDGMIKHFEQISKVAGKKPRKFKTEEIFYLARNRVADEIHGRGIIQKLKRIMDMKNESMADNRIAMHRNVIPRWKFKLKTDDPAEIAAYKAKQDAATGLGENIYEPFDVSEGELISVPANATLNPMSWINYLDTLFYQTAGIPKIIVGGSSEFTEKASSIVYLAFQQSVEEEQLYIEEQVLSQLNLVIDLEFPADLTNELLSDKKKDGPENIQPNETTAGAGQ